MCWYAHTEFSHTKCDPALGDAATLLQGVVPDVRSTKLGYGDARLTFNIDDDLAVGFDVRSCSDGPTFVFIWRYLHSLNRLTHDDALDLVRVLRDWNARRLERRERT